MFLVFVIYIYTCIHKRISPKQILTIHFLSRILFMLQGLRNEHLARQGASMAHTTSGGCERPSHGHHQKFIALLILCFLDCGHGDGKGEFALSHLFTKGVSFSRCCQDGRILVWFNGDRVSDTKYVMFQIAKVSQSRKS